VRRALDEAAALRRRAQQDLDKYQERLRSIEAEVAQLLGNVRREAEAERARIIAAAEAQAVQLQRDAEAQIQVEIERARRDLQRRASEAAVGAAEALLKGQIQEVDHKRLVDTYVTSVENM